jgi:hypothetical protein
MEKYFVGDVAGGRGLLVGRPKSPRWYLRLLRWAARLTADPVTVFWPRSKVSIESKLCLRVMKGDGGKLRKFIFEVFCFFVDEKCFRSASAARRKRPLLPVSNLRFLFRLRSFMRMGMSSEDVWMSSIGWKQCRSWSRMFGVEYPELGWLFHATYFLRSHSNRTAKQMDES